MNWAAVVFAVWVVFIAYALRQLWKHHKRMAYAQRALAVLAQAERGEIPREVANAFARKVVHELEAGTYP